MTLLDDLNEVLARMAFLIAINDNGEHVAIGSVGFFQELPIRQVDTHLQQHAEELLPSLGRQRGSVLDQSYDFLLGKTVSQRTDDILWQQSIIDFQAMAFLQQIVNVSWGRKSVIWMLQNMN